MRRRAALTEMQRSAAPKLWLAHQSVMTLDKVSSRTLLANANIRLGAQSRFARCKLAAAMV